jgi:hypothetical protein
MNEHRKKKRKKKLSHREEGETNYRCCKHSPWKKRKLIHL